MPRCSYDLPGARGAKPPAWYTCANVRGLVWALVLASAVGGLASVAGCAKGPWWRTGYLSPWARQKWAEEEQIAETLFTRRRQMQEMVRTANARGRAEQQRAAEILGDVVRRDPILLIRLEAVRLLAQLPGPAADAALEAASSDASHDVRLAAVEAWRQKGGDEAAAALQRMVGSDSNIDVRLAATKALGTVGRRDSMVVLGTALGDSNPALRARAVEALKNISGEDYGTDTGAWRQYIARETNVDSVGPSGNLYR